jgi:hypothetical protein
LPESAQPAHFGLAAQRQGKLAGVDIVTQVCGILRLTVRLDRNALVFCSYFGYTQFVDNFNQI